MVDWAEVKKDFPASSSYAYFKAGSGGILSKAAAEACTALYQDWSANGDLNFTNHEAGLQVLREDLALALRFPKDLASAASSRIALTTNASEGMNYAVFLATKNGFEALDVVSLWNEFPSVTLPWVNKGSSLHLVPQNDVDRLGVITAIKQTLQGLPQGCKACLAVSHVSFADGSRVPLIELGQICQELGAWFVVDASQSFGVFPVDVQAACIDAVVCNGYKWLCAGYGAGFAYMSERLLALYDKAPFIGWHNVEDMGDISQFKVKDRALRFMDGAPPFPGLVALHASLRYLESLGWTSITDRVLYLNRRLADALQGAGYNVVSPLVDEQRSGNLIVQVCGSPQAIAATLKEKGIIVKDQTHSLRISTHIYNNEAEIDRLVAALLSISPPRISISVQDVMLGAHGQNHPEVVSGPCIVERQQGLVVLSAGDVRSTGPCTIVVHLSLSHSGPKLWAEGVRLVNLKEECSPLAAASNIQSTIVAENAVRFECVVGIASADQGIRTVEWQLHDSWGRALGVIVCINFQ